MYLLKDNKTGKGVPPTIPYPKNMAGEAFIFNTMVRGYDVFGNPVQGVVRGYGPPVGYFDGIRNFDPAGSYGPDSALVIIDKLGGDGLVECYADMLEYVASLSAAPHDVGLVRDNATGRFSPA